VYLCTVLLSGMNVNQKVPDLWGEKKSVLGLVLVVPKLSLASSQRYFPKVMEWISIKICALCQRTALLSLFNGGNC